MSLAAEYNDWHQRVFDGAPENPDEESPWYKLVIEYLPSVRDQRILEIACGRGGFSRLLASRAHACSAQIFPAPRYKLRVEKRTARERNRTAKWIWRKPTPKTCLTRKILLTRSSPARRSSTYPILQRRSGKWPASPAPAAHFS